MLKTEASVTVDRPVDETWRFLSDWDCFQESFVLEPGEGVKKTSDGPLALNSTIELAGQFRGRSMVMDMRVSEFEPNRKITLEYVSGSFRGSRKIYILESDETGRRTRLTHVSEGEFRGSWRIMAFLLRPMALGGLKKTTKEELDRVSRGISH